MAPEKQESTVEVAHPSIKPQLVLLFVLVVSFLVIGYYIYKKGEDMDSILIWLVVAVVILLIARVVLKIIVLRNISYKVTTKAIERDLDFLLRKERRRVPLKMLRGLEISQSRLQTIFGMGSVSFLTGGTDQSLGFIAFENVSQPKQMCETVEDLVGRLKWP